jgi:hypothetical protein
LLVESSDEETANLVVAELLEEVDRMELNEDIPSESSSVNQDSLSEYAAATRIEPHRASPKPSQTT